MDAKAPLLTAVAMTALACQRTQTDEQQPARSAAKAEADGPAAPDDARAEPKLTSATFDDVEPGAIPKGFDTAETNGAGRPATWAVVDDATATSPPRAFGVTQASNDGQFNLAIWSAGPSYAAVDIHVMLRAVSGQRDQGGGVMFRAAGPDDYYVARWNPLEDNARFYIVQGGARSALGKVDLQLDPDAWHAMRVVAEGKRMELFLDDEPVLTVEDATLSSAGKIGLWTKTDAATLFDDLTVASL